MKTAIITGANGNLGIATVKKFLDEGYKVVAIDGKNDHLCRLAGAWSADVCLGTDPVWRVGERRVAFRNYQKGARMTRCASPPVARTFA